MKIEFLDKISLLEYLPKIIDLYNVCFNRGLDQQSFIWRYIKNPIEDLLFVIATDSDNNVIASYSASPSLMEIDGNTFKTAMSLNTMTHPDYQGKGLFVTLAESLYNHMIENDYKII